MFKKALATVALAVMATFAFAPAANAAGYVPDALVTQEENPVAGETTVIAFAEDAFVGNEFVDFTVTGSHEATLSVIKTAVDSSLRKQAVGGAVSVNIDLHPDAFGTYTLTGVGADSGLIGIASATIVPADTGAATGNSASGLSGTGYNVPVLVIWGAGGLLALGVALVLVRISIRRQQLAK